MVSEPRRKLSFETEWLRGYVQTYLPSDSVFSVCPDDLRVEGISLTDLNHVFRCGEVVFSEKLDGPGAEWVVVGENCDGDKLEICLHVETNTLRIELMYANRVEEDCGGNDAA